MTRHHLDVLKLEVETTRVTTNRLLVSASTAVGASIVVNPSMTVNTTGWTPGPGVTVTATASGGRWLGAGLAAGALVGNSGNLTVAAGKVLAFQIAVVMRQTAGSGRIRATVDAYNGAVKLATIGAYTAPLGTVAAVTLLAFNTAATPTNTTHVVISLYAVDGGAFDYITSGFQASPVAVVSGSWTATGAGVTGDTNSLALYGATDPAYLAYPLRSATAGQWVGFGATIDTQFVTPDRPVSISLRFYAADGVTQVGIVSQTTPAQTAQRLTLLAQAPPGAVYAAPRVHLHDPVLGATYSPVNYAVVSGLVVAVDDERSYANRSEVADAASVTNLLPNATGREGSWGWATPVASSTLYGGVSGLLGGPWLVYTPAVGVANFLWSDRVAVTPGQFIAARWTVAFLPKYYRARIEFLDAAGALVSSTALTGYLTGVVQDQQYGAFTVPVGVTYARLRFDTYADAAGAVNAATTEQIAFGFVTLATAATSGALAALPFVEGTRWVDILAPAHEVRISRSDLDLGTVTATILDADLDPATASDVRPGRRVRVRAYNPTAGAWRSLFTGKLNAGQTTYDRKGRARITLTGTDNIGPLANSTEARGVATIAQLPFILEGLGVPWLVNGSGQQVSSATVVSSNDNASVLDQVSITRDSALGYAWIDKDNVLTAYDSTSMPAAVAAVFSDVTGSSYSDIDASFDTDSTINDVRVVWLRYDAATGETQEVVYGPYVDAASVAAWGPHSATFTVHGPAASETTVGIAAYAASILARNATPTVRAKGLKFPVRMSRDDQIATAAELDLYDLVTVAYAPAGLNTNVRVTSVDHSITPEKWTVSVGLGGENVVASPQATPSPPPSLTAPAVTPVMQVFTSGGTWTKPDGLKAVRVRVQAGGGGGGGAGTTGAAQASAGGGGGGGGFAEEVIPAASLTATVAVTVGAAGTASAAGSGAAGGTGGSSSFGAFLSATGGAGGLYSTAAANAMTAGGAGGAGSGGNINVPGQAGGQAHVNASEPSQPSVGGSSVLGSGGQPATGTNAAAGNAGIVYGGGGSGGILRASQASVAGAVGAQGVVIVESLF